MVRGDSMLNEFTGVLTAAVYSLTIFIFVSGALGKLQNISNFKRVIEDYAIFPVNLTRLVSVGIPGAELVFIAMALIPQTQFLGFFCLVFLLTSYTILLLVSNYRGIELADCGCAFKYSSGKVNRVQKVDALLIFRNLGLLGLCIFALTFNDSMMQLATFSWLLALAVSCLLLLFYWIYEILIQNHHLLLSLRSSNG
jgi:hypothetical protein